MKKQIIAIGGAALPIGVDNLLLVDYFLRQTGKRKPKVCFIGTAHGDADAGRLRFYAGFGQFNCKPTHLPLFARTPRDLASFVLEQDAIFVGGGNTRSMLAVWRDWGVPQVLRNAAARGTVLAGVSAGAICWFEWGASDSASPGTRSGPLRCLGFLKGSCSPHWGGEVHRRRDFHAMIRRGDVPAGYGISDGAALLFENSRLVEAVSTDPAAGAFRVERTGDRLCETPLPTRALASLKPPAPRRATR